MEKHKVKTQFYVILLMVFSIMLMNSCSYDVESELGGNSECDRAISYSLNVLPILEDNCLGCHSASENSGGVTLEGYDNLISWVEDSFYCSINHDSGCSPMPKNQPQLSDCDIRSIKTWIDEGAQNN